MKHFYLEKWQAMRARTAFLALADGTLFHGVAFGARRDCVGEVVFNTGMSGYQEILTDPSYAGQFVTLTSAEIGNYGINPDDVESRGLFLHGLIVNEMNEPSNYRATQSLENYLRENHVPGLAQVDTRALTLHLRAQGNQKAYLHVEETPLSEEEAVARAQAWVGLDGQDYASRVTCEKGYSLSLPGSVEEVSKPLVVAYDFGMKTNILRSLASFARVQVVPAHTSAEEVLKLKPNGVFLSNGPADPAAVTYAIENVRMLLGKVPLMGICLGHQLLSLACGARTHRLKFGHHGCNHPVKDLATGRVEITSQNHNFAVDPASVPACLAVTHLNLNDQTIEGVRHQQEPAFSVQYHPESCPGPHDSYGLFDQFRKMLQ